MAYFTEEFITFFGGLALHNEKSWMDAHRHEYKKHVKAPWDVFVADLLERVREFATIDDLPTGKFQFRINRDVRFSHDKTPYNPWVSAAIAQSGKKDPGPAYYLRLSVDGLSIGGGVYQPEKAQLASIRRAIMNNPKALTAIVTKPRFMKFWDPVVLGEQNKVLPKEFKEAAASVPLLYNKSFTYMKSGPIDPILDDDFLDVVVSHFEAAKEFNNFLDEAARI